MNLGSVPVSNDLDSKDSAVTLTIAVSWSNQAIARWMRVAPDCLNLNHYFLPDMKTHR